MKEEVSDYDIGPLLMELNMQASLYAGTETNYVHYSLSLSPDESLTPYQCLVAARLLMIELGYGSDTRWTSVIHHMIQRSLHVHVVACRVKLDRTLVDDSNDYARGVDAARKIEIELGLANCKSPEANFGHEYSIVNIKMAVVEGAYMLCMIPPV